MKTILTTLAATAAITLLGAVPASAHTVGYSADCDAVTINLTGYEGPDQGSSTNNHVTVKINGEVVRSAPFATEYSDTIPFPEGALEFMYEIEVDANTTKGNPTKFDKKVSRYVRHCEPAPTTTTPAPTTTTPAPVDVCYSNTGTESLQPGDYELKSDYVGSYGTTSFNFLPCGPVEPEPTTPEPTTPTDTTPTDTTPEPTAPPTTTASPTTSVSPSPGSLPETGSNATLLLSLAGLGSLLAGSGIVWAVRR